jgi:hypothetical protein
MNALQSGAALKELRELQAVEMEVPSEETTEANPSRIGFVPSNSEAAPSEDRAETFRTSRPAAASSNP